ncbi:Bax inhibitor-1 family protein, partial [Staphylococcus aureus]|uniref:Bax inhibitor-1 family protein n=1 Tax=Staphylococcus aureus TaxID=1280 RepID=UPI0019163AC9
LIAYDTQRLKMIYYQVGGDQAAMGVATSFGALTLYLDFINLFQFLLSLFGDRRCSDQEHFPKSGNRFSV